MLDTNELDRNLAESCVDVEARSDFIVPHLFAIKGFELRSIPLCTVTLSFLHPVLFSKSNTLNTNFNP